MKQSQIIKSVQSRVQFVEKELRRTVEHQLGPWLFWKRMAKKQAILLKGYTTVSTCSVTVPLTGLVEITFLDSCDQVAVIHIPTATQFFVTCISKPSGDFFPGIESSLS